MMIDFLIALAIELISAAFIVAIVHVCVKFIIPKSWLRL
jgi:hypothetical protein